MSDEKPASRDRQVAEFCNALIGSYEGKVEFEIGSGEIVVANTAAEFSALPADSYILNTQTGMVPFVFMALLENGEVRLKELPLAPTASLVKDGQYLVAYAFDDPVAIDDAIVLAGFEPYTAAIPLPGTNGWALDSCDPETFYPHPTIDEAFGDHNEEIGRNVNLPAPVLDVAPPKLEEDAAVVTPINTQPPKQVTLHNLKTYGDAVVHGDYDEGDAISHREIVVTFGANRESRMWKKMPMPLGRLFAFLSHHREGPKDGPAFMYCEVVGTKRGKNAVTSVTAAAFDIDNGMPSYPLDQLLATVGFRCVRYTTHSHLKSSTDVKRDDVVKFISGKLHGSGTPEDPAVLTEYLRQTKNYDPSVLHNVILEATERRDSGIWFVVGHERMAKHRVVLPFEVPFTFEALALQKSQDQWRKVYFAIARSLGNLPIDRTGSDPNRLFYHPRHAKGAPYEISLFAGPLLDWRNVSAGDPWEDVDKALNKNKPKSVTLEGRALGLWSKKRAGGFAISDVIRNEAPDKVREEKGDKLEIECPFDEEHSNAGDESDRACMTVNAGEGTSPVFTISCRHDGCKEKTNLDMLGKMIKDGWFDQSVLEDEEYQALLEEPGATSDYDALLARIADLSDPSPAEINALLDLVATRPDQIERGNLIKKIKKQAPDNTVKDMAARVKSQLKENTSSSVNNNLAKDYDGIVRFSYHMDFDATDAGKMVKAVTLAQNHVGGRPEPVLSNSLGEMFKMQRDESGVSFARLDSAGFSAETNIRMQFVRYEENGNAGPRKNVDDGVLKTVFNTAYKFLPRTPDVLRVPVFGQGGKIIAEPGWHEADDVYLHLGSLEVPFYLAPSVEQMNEARTFIEVEILGEFPLLDHTVAGEESRAPAEANAISMILTLFMRRMISGCTPLFLITKPQPGTGGTLLGSIPSLIFEGTEPPAMPFHRNNDEENRKQIISALLGGATQIFYDNVVSLKSDNLLQVLTAPNIGGRLLGQSVNVVKPNRLLWIATGNNPDTEEQMDRRTCHIRLNAKMPDVRIRKFSKNFAPWLVENRARAITAVLTIIQSWIVSGQRPFSARTLLGYEDWAAKVGGVIEHVWPEHAFLDNARASMVDPDHTAIVQFVEAWAKRWGNDTKSLPEFIRWTLDISPDFLSGVREDQQKLTVQRKLASLSGRTFDVGADKIRAMVVHGVSDSGDHTIALDVVKRIQT